MASEAPETKVNLFLGFVRPVTNSIHMVEGPGGHFGPSITPRMCFKVYNLVKDRPRSIFLYEFLIIFEAPETQLKLFLGL